MMVLLNAIIRVSHTWCRSFNTPLVFTSLLVKLCAPGSSSPSCPIAPESMIVLPAESFTWNSTQLS